MKKPKCLFYAHDGFGMGHIGRCACLSDALKRMYPQWDVIIVTGDKQAFSMLPENVELVKLPSFSKIPDSDNTPQMKPAALSSFALTITLRKQILETLLTTYGPSVIIVDYSVRGLGRELSGVLDAYKEKNPECQLILGLRGVLGLKEHIGNELFTNGNMEYIKRYYDKVFVYIDKKVIDIASYYSLPDWMKEKLMYTGYVTISENKNNNCNCFDTSILSADEPYLGVGMGSGIGAESILMDILNALKEVKGLPDKKVIITGPKFSRETFDQLVKIYPDFIFKYFTSEYATFVSKANYFIGLAGYNTISHWLQGTNPALFIARDQKRGEQQLHLQSLENLGLCVTLNEADAGQDILISKIESLVKIDNINNSLAMHGESFVADYVNKLQHCN